MIITRKIGSLIRGKASPFQIYAACLLGSFLGFLPGFSQAPALMLFWIFLLLVLNANIFLAGLVTLLAKAVFLLTMPALFAIGRLLLEGPTQGLFKWVVNAPVGAYSGFDYYVVAGGQLVAVILGVVLGAVLTGALKRYRRKMAELSVNSERLKKYNEKGWAKAVKWIFFGGGRGKKSYEELMAVKMGNPIRIWGAALVAVCIALLVLGFNFLSGPFLTSIAKSQLEQANGATVDLEKVDLRLSESKLEVLGLAFADPQNLDTNVFEATRLVADVNAADLLRKRFSVDQLTIENGASGAARDSAGSIVGPKPKTDGKMELPDFQDLSGVLENSEVWKERLAQAKRWLEQLTATDEPEKALSWEDQLNARIQSVGYAHVKADFLTEGSPVLWIRNLNAMGVATPYFDGATLDIVGSDLSTHPSLVPNPPTLTIDSDNERFDARLSLAEATGVGTNDVRIRIRSYPVDAFAANLKSSGQPPLSGGTMDIELSGRISAVENDLLANVGFKGTTARIGGEPVSLDGVSLPVQIRGPLDEPGVRLESKALEKILVSAGKQRLLEEASEKLGIETKDGDKPKDLLKGILERKLKKE